MNREGDGGSDGGKRSPWGTPKRGPGARAEDDKVSSAWRPKGDPKADPEPGSGRPAAQGEERTGVRPDPRDADGRRGWQANEADSTASRPATRGPWQRGAGAHDARARGANAGRDAGSRDRRESGGARGYAGSQQASSAPGAPPAEPRRGPPRERRAEAGYTRPQYESGHERSGERAAGGFPKGEPEQKICGMNAARAAFAARPEALRKVYLSEARIGTLRELLAFCVAKRLGYRVVEDEELERISGSSHHEGVCLLMQPRPELDFERLLERLPKSGPVRLLWLDGVGNPHNLGAVLRSAAHFGVQAVLLPPQTTLTLSAAAARVAEGGAEHVPLVRLQGQGANAEIAALERLTEAGFVSLATLPAAAPDLYAQPLPQRAVFVLGAEGEGMQRRLVEHCERRVCIPGSGRVESLNIANAVAVLLAEHWRQFPA